MTAGPGFDPGAFHSFEHAGWERVAERYHGRFEAVTSQSIGPLLDAVHTGSGTRLLDVASGPGYVAGAALERGAKVTGLDFAANMVQLAHRLNPGVEFRQGDAQNLPFNDAAFDAVVMNYGILHLSDPDRALREACRVLCPGGRAAFTAWCGPEEARGLGIVMDAVEKHGRTDVPLPPGPPFFRFADAEEWIRALGDAGFVDVSVRKLDQSWLVSRAHTFVDEAMESTVRTAGLLKAQTPGDLAAIRLAVVRMMESFHTPEGYLLPVPAMLACGMKPAF